MKRSHVTLTFDLKSLYTLPLCNQCEWSINQVGPSREGRIYGPDRYLIQYVCYDFNLWRRNRCTDLSLKDTRKAWSCLSLLFQGINLYTLRVNKKISIKSHFPWTLTNLPFPSCQREEDFLVRCPVLWVWWVPSLARSSWRCRPPPDWLGNDQELFSVPEAFRPECW